MKRLLVALVVLAAAVIVAFVMRTTAMRTTVMIPGPDEIEFRGERYKLTKEYSDYDDYKEDPENIHPSENSRVAGAILDATLATSYAGRDAMFRAVSGLQFPGYGMGSLGDQPQPDGSSLAGFYVEVPRAGKDRFFVFRGRGGRYALIDDFAVASGSEILKVREEGGQLVYSTFEGKPVLSRPLAADPR